MNELNGLCVALASLMALTCWARSAPTRAWGDSSPAPRRAWAVALATVVLQVLTATAAAGLAAGVTLVVAAWMVLGWLLVLAMNQWPTASLQWARRLGGLGGAGCVLALARHFFQA